MARFDVVIIGADLNGLTAAAVLAKARRRVLVLDAGDSSAPSPRLPPGFTIEPVAEPAWVSDEIRRDLELDRHGFELLPPEATLACLGTNGEALVIRRDQRVTVDEIRRRSTRDAERWPAFTARMAKLSAFLGWLYHRPPPLLKASGLNDWLDLASLGRRARALGKADLVELARVLPMPVADFVEETFDDPLLRAGIAAGAVAGLQQGPRSGGTTFAWLHHHVGSEPGAIRLRQRVRGGSAAIVRVVTQAARSFGAEIRASAPVASIRINDRRASGVVLENGDEIDARDVMSSLGIRRTLLELVGPAVLDPELVRAIGNIRYRGVVARVHLALDRLPSFNGVPDEALGGVVSVTPTLDGIERAYDDAKYGRVSSEPVLEIRIPSVADPAVAPSGQHLMSISMQYAPYRLREGHWDDRQRDAIGDLVMSRLSAIAPGLESRVLRRYVLTPRDLAEQHGLPEGSIDHGELALDQALFMRPVAKCSRYRTPIQRLFLCGSDMHPGRGVAGGAGRLAAKEVLKGS